MEQPSLVGPGCEFIDEFADGSDEEPVSGGARFRGNVPRASKAKQPWRYGWPDDIRDEVLARLREFTTLCEPGTAG
jgi:hypothetical protein